LPAERHQKQQAIHSERHRGRCADGAREGRYAEQGKRHQRGIAVATLGRGEQDRGENHGWQGDGEQAGRCAALDGAQRQAAQGDGAEDLAGRIEASALRVGRFRHG
jgi:hypothetical protein